MKKVLVLLLSSLLVTSTTWAADAPKRLKFAKGATVLKVTDTISKTTKERHYVLKLRAGQTLEIDQINIKSVSAGQTQKLVTTSLSGPTNDDLNDSDLSCNARKKVSSTKAGDYHLVVMPCGKVDPWTGSYTLSIKAK